MKRPSATFCNGKNSVLNNLLRRIKAYYTLENKVSKTCEYLPNKTYNNLIEDIHERCSYSPSQTEETEETMQYHKIRGILQFDVPNKLLSSKRFAHHVLLLFYPFKDERELLSGFPPLYQSKMQQ